MPRVTYTRDLAGSDYLCDAGISRPDAGPAPPSVSLVANTLQKAGLINIVGAVWDCWMSGLQKAPASATARSRPITNGFFLDK